LRREKLIEAISISWEHPRVGVAPREGEGRLGWLSTSKLLELLHPPAFRNVHSTADDKAHQECSWEFDFLGFSTEGIQCSLGFSTAFRWREAVWTRTCAAFLLDWGVPLLDCRRDGRILDYNGAIQGWLMPSGQSGVQKSNQAYNATRDCRLQGPPWHSLLTTTSY